VLQYKTELIVMSSVDMEICLSVLIWRQRLKFRKLTNETKLGTGRTDEQRLLTRNHKLLSYTYFTLRRTCHTWGT